MNEDQKPLRNPYTADLPVVGKSFFDREKVFQLIDAALVMSQQRLVVLRGQRRIGKSSIFKELPYRLPVGNFVIVNFDLQYYTGQDLTKVLFALAQSISDELDLQPPARADFEENELFFENTFLEMVERSLEEHQRLLILIDEFDIIRETEQEGIPVASREFTALLERLIISEKRLSFILVISNNPTALSGYMQAVFRLGATIEVSFLGEEEARHLIVEPAKDTLLTYSETTVKAILSLTSGHPYFTQLLCLEIFKQAIFTNDMAVDLDEVEAAMKQSLISGEGAFAWIWNELTLAERIYSSAVASAASRNQTQIVSNQEIEEILGEYDIRLIGADMSSAAKDLVGRKFLEPAGPDQYRFTVELIRHWIDKEHPLDNAKQDIENINHMARARYEEARKAHAVGDLTQAIEYYQAAVRANPNHARAQIGLAQALYEKREWESAVREFERAYDLDEANAKPGLVEALLVYGRHLEKQDTDKALSIYKHVFDYAPGNISAKTRVNQLNPSLLKRLYYLPRRLYYALFRPHKKIG